MDLFDEHTANFVSYPLGLTLQEDLTNELNLSVWVGKLEKGSRGGVGQADRLGVKVGDAVSKVNGVSVAGLDFKETIVTIRKGKTPVLITFLRPRSIPCNEQNDSTNQGNGQQAVVDSVKEKDKDGMVEEENKKKEDAVAAVEEDESKEHAIVEEEEEEEEEEEVVVVKNKQDAVIEDKNVVLLDDEDQYPSKDTKQVDSRQGASLVIKKKGDNEEQLSTQTTNDNIHRNSKEKSLSLVVGGQTSSKVHMTTEVDARDNQPISGASRMDVEKEISFADVSSFPKPIMEIQMQPVVNQSENDKEKKNPAYQVEIGEQVIRSTINTASFSNAVPNMKHVGQESKEHSEKMENHHNRIEMVKHIAVDESDAENLVYEESAEPIIEKKEDTPKRVESYHDKATAEKDRQVQTQGTSIPLPPSSRPLIVDNPRTTLLVHDVSSTGFNNYPRRGIKRPIKDTQFELTRIGLEFGKTLLRRSGEIEPIEKRQKTQSMKLLCSETRSLIILFRYLCHLTGYCQQISQKLKIIENHRDKIMNKIRRYQHEAKLVYDTIKIEKKIIVLHQSKIIGIHETLVDEISTLRKQLLSCATPEDTHAKIKDCENMKIQNCKMHQAFKDKVAKQYSIYSKIYDDTHDRNVRARNELIQIQDYQLKLYAELIDIDLLGSEIATSLNNLLDKKNSILSHQSTSPPHPSPQKRTQILPQGPQFRTLSSTQPTNSANATPPSVISAFKNSHLPPQSTPPEKGFQLPPVEDTLPHSFRMPAQDRQQC